MNTECIRAKCTAQTTNECQCTKEKYEQELEQLKEQIMDAKNCLVCASIADPLEVRKNVLDILENKS